MLLKDDFNKRAISGIQANLGPANVTLPTLEAVLRLTGMNVLPFNDAKTTAFVDAVAAGVTGMSRANISIIQVWFIKVYFALTQCDGHCVTWSGEKVYSVQLA